MSEVLTTLFLAYAVAASPATAQEGSKAMAQTNSARAVRVETTIKAPVAEVWRAWTTSEGGRGVLRSKSKHSAGDWRTL
jgi:uncharacterized membrane protein